MHIFHVPFPKVNHYLVQAVMVQVQGPSRQESFEAQLQHSGESTDPVSVSRGMVGTQELGTACPDKGSSWHK